MVVAEKPGGKERMRRLQQVLWASEATQCGDLGTSQEARAVRCKKCRQVGLTTPATLLTDKIIRMMQGVHSQHTVCLIASHQFFVLRMSILSVTSKARRRYHW